MAKVKRDFSFEIPVSGLTTTNGLVTRFLVGNIEVSGIVALMHNREHEVDYNFIKWNGVDIFPLLDNFMAADDLLQAVMDAALNHIANTFELDVDLGINLHKNNMHPLFETIYNGFTTLNKAV